MIRAIGLLDQPELSIQACRFPLHQNELLVGHAAWLDSAAAGNELSFRGAGEKRLGVTDGELVHCHHGLSDFDLPFRPHLPQSIEGVDRDMLVLEQRRGVGTDPIEQTALCAECDRA